MSNRRQTTTASRSARSYSAASLRTWAQKILQRISLPSADAVHAADVLVRTSLRGVDTHGIIYLPRYVREIRQGHVNPQPNIRVEGEAPATAVMNGDNGLGIVAGVRAMREALRRARLVGAAAVSVRNSTHFGAAAYYVQMASAEGFIGLAFSNAEAIMAPWGSHTLLLGNNPFAIAAPGGIDGGVVLDMATTKVAWGRLDLAARAGEKIPLGWATDRQGRPTDDPRVGMSGLMLPLAEHKGYGLSVMVEILCSVLSGAAYGTHIVNGRDLAHLFFAIEVARFAPFEAFQTRMTQLVDEIHACEPAEGVSRVYVPGEIEMEIAARREREGIPVTPDLATELIELGEQVGEPFLS